MQKLFAVLVLLLTSTSFAQTRTDFVMNVEEVDREFIVQRPSGNAPAGGYPVVFMFHGTSGDGEKFYNISGWKEKGELDKILTVFPSSRKYCVSEDGEPPHQTTKWYNGDLASVACPGQTFKDDVFFVRQMLDTLIKTYNVNPSRIYVSGFSNGACMAAKLAMEASDIIAAAAYTGAMLHELDSAQPIITIPMWNAIGNRDDRITSKIGQDQVPFNDSLLRYMNGIITRSIGALRLSEDYTKDSTALSLTYSFNTPLPGEAPASFRFTLLKDLFHQYPNGSNYPVSAAEVFWTYFMTKTLPSKVDVEFENAATTVHPNPAVDHITVTESGRLTIFAPTGGEVLSDVVEANVRIELPVLAKGVYYIRIDTKDGNKISKLVIR